LAANKWSGERQRRSKLQVVTVGYCSGGLMKEEIITFTISYGLPNDSRKISHQTQRQFSTGCYHIVFFTDIFQLILEWTVPLPTSDPPPSQGILEDRDNMKDTSN